MAYKETRTVGLGKRLGSSLSGLLVGLMMIAGGSFLLWWNEGNFVAADRAINEARAVTVELGDITVLDPSKNGRLVHAVGPVETNDELEDPIFGLKVKAIRLERKVEYYQWVERSSSETRTKIGGEEETVTTYTYERKWVDRPVDSSAFHDPSAVSNNKNSVLTTIESARFQAANVGFGAYRLPGFLINSIRGAEPFQVSLTEEKAAELNRRLSPSAPISHADWPDRALVHASDNTVFLGASPDSPQIGNVRVSFQVTRPAMVSLMAQCAGDTFTEYRAANGRTFSRLDLGARSLEEMYDSAHSENSLLTWLLRLAGLVLVIAGLKGLTAPLTVLASVLPPLGRLVNLGTSLVSIPLGLAWSLLVISLAWLRFRPLIGLSLIAAAGALIALLYVRGRARKTV